MPSNVAETECSVEALPAFVQREAESNLLRLSFSLFLVLMPKLIAGGRTLLLIHWAWSTFAASIIMAPHAAPEFPG
jgi:hypothetical protein